MLAKKYRLNLRLERKRFDKAKRTHSPDFTVLILSSPDIHFGFLIGKKLAKSAVQRNLIRRRLHEIVRLHLPQIPVADYLIIPKSSILKYDYETLQNALLSSLYSRF